MPYTTGSLIKTRGREWVVLPETTADWLILRPLGGADREIAGVYLPLEGNDVQPAAFDLPDPARPGDFQSCRLLRDAVRLGFRSSAGPFRSFARLDVESRFESSSPSLIFLQGTPSLKNEGVFFIIHRPLANVSIAEPRRMARMAG